MKSNIKSTSKKVGYARVSKEEQNLQLQLDELKLAGCETIFTDKVSGSKNNRVGLAECLDNLQKGDTLIVWRLDRLGRSLGHLISVVNGLKDRGVAFKSLKDGAIDTTTASGELVFNIFAALAQLERELIRERTNAGLKAAKARGRLGGRKPMKRDNPKVLSAQKLHAGKMNDRDICDTLKISRCTFYRYLKK